MQDLRKEDFVDLDIVDQVELSSDGSVGITSPFYGPATVTSTTSGTKTVVVPVDANGEGLQSGDHVVKAGDKAILTGTSGGAGDGTFTVATVPTQTSFTTVEAIGTSTGGTVTFQHKAGAKNVGVDSTGLSKVAHTDAQSAIADLDTINLDHLLDNEPPTPTNDYAITRSSNLVTREAWTNHATSKLVKSIDYTRTSGLVTQEVRKVFASDGVTITAQLTIVYTRSGGRVTSATYTRNV